MLKTSHIDISKNCQILNLYSALEILCAVPTAPYDCPSAATTRSIGTSPSDYHCATNYKWDDNKPGSLTRAATCTINVDLINADWDLTGTEICVGMNSARCIQIDTK